MQLIIAILVVLRFYLFICDFNETSEKFEPLLDKFVSELFRINYESNCVIKIYVNKQKTLLTILYVVFI